MSRALLGESPGRRELLLGNEAVVRGAIEADVRFVAGYPGTPASEIGDAFADLAPGLGIAFQFSVNEKVALEAAFGASLAGARSLVSMKHLGLSYGADPLSTMPMIGVRGGMVIVSAADPGCLTSPNEQDQRHLARMFGIPVLDPADPDEARRMAIFAFDLSEASRLPVLLRMTTRVCHTRAMVEFGAVRRMERTFGIDRDPGRLIPTPVHARRMRTDLDDRLRRAAALVAASPFNAVRSGTSRCGVVVAGAPRGAVLEAVERHGLPLPVLEVGTVHPLPEPVVLAFLRGLDEVLVVEELSPFLEDALFVLAGREALPVRIHGKNDGRMQGPFELPFEEIEARLLDLAGRDRPRPPARGDALPAAPARPPVLCAGCPHRNSFHAAVAAFGRDTVMVNDIGCYTLGVDEPFAAGHTLLAMGSSIPMAGAIARVTGQRTVAFVGDSTFYHSALPAVANAVARRDDVVIVVLDNHVTAMTGLQPSPEIGSIADVARSLGVEDVREMPVADPGRLLAALNDLRRGTGVALLVATGPCALLLPPAGAGGRQEPPTVDPSRCHTCGMAEAGLHCGLEPSTASQWQLVRQRALHPASKVDVPRTSSCAVECPVGICIPAYVGAMAAGEPERALAAVRLRTALPSACAYVCHRPCETVCVRAAEDRPVAVNRIKRWLADHHLPEPGAGKPAPAGPRIAIVGAGPAGLAAARDLVARGLAPVLLDARERPGGMLEWAVPEYRMPREALRRDIGLVLAEGVAFRGGVKLGRDMSLEGLREEGFAAVLLATGTPLAPRLPIPGADLPAAADALAFLAEDGRIDGADVVVVGGGDVAVDCARLALRRGARAALLVCPEPRDDMRAAPDAVLAALDEGARLLDGRAALAFDGRTLRIAAIRGFRREGLRVAWEGLGAAEAVSASRIVFATGLAADVASLGLPANLALSGGFIVADGHGRTAVPWLFAAGDVTLGPSTVTEALASGVRAAFAIHERLAAGAAVPPPAAPPRRPRPAVHVHATPEPDVLRTADAARSEAARCFLCGLCGNCNSCVELHACPAIGRSGPGTVPFIDPVLCTSCGGCVQICPSGAIG